MAADGASREDAGAAAPETPGAEAGEGAEGAEEEGSKFVGAFEALDLNHDGLIDAFEFGTNGPVKKDEKNRKEQREEDEAKEEKWWITWPSLEKRVKNNRWLGLSTSEDQTVKLWDFDDRGNKMRGTLNGPGEDQVHEAPIRVAVLDWSLRRGVTGAIDGTLALWNLETFELINSFLSGKYGAFTAIDADFEKKRILTGTGEGIMCIWDSERLRHLRAIHGHDGAKITLCRGSFEEGRGVSGAIDGRLRTWDLETGAVLGTFDMHAGAISYGIVDFDNLRILSGDDDGVMHLWHLESRAQLVATRTGST